MKMFSATIKSVSILLAKITLLMAIGSFFSIGLTIICLFLVIASSDYHSGGAFFDWAMHLLPITASFPMLGVVLLAGCMGVINGIKTPRNGWFTRALYLTVVMGFTLAAIANWLLGFYLHHHSKL